MVSDLAKAVDVLSARYGVPRKKITVGGASVGANLAFRYAAKNEDVPFVILLSPGLNYQGLTTPDLVALYGKRPLAMAAGAGDPGALNTVNVLERMCPDKSRVTVFREGPAAGHGVQMFKRSDEKAPSDLEKSIVEWIEAHAK